MEKVKNGGTLSFISSGKFDRFSHGLCLQERNKAECFVVMQRIEVLSQS